MKLISQSKNINLLDTKNKIALNSTTGTNEKRSVRLI